MPWQRHPAQPHDESEAISKGVAEGRHLPDHSLASAGPAQLAAQVAAADRFAAAIGYQSGQPIDDAYRQRTYQALLARGEPVAEAQRNAEFWARLKAAAPESVHGPGETIDEMMAEYRAKRGDGPGPSITQDPITGVSTYNPGYQPQAAATSFAPAGGPPTMIEYSRSWFGMSQPINRFSMNPGAEFYASIAGPAPTMFGAGDLPIMTGSGVDPSMLRWVAWPIRHTAAFAESRATVAMLIEMSLAGDPDGWQESGLVSADGRDALNDYFGRIATWVQALPLDADGLPGDLSVEEIKRFYPDE